MPEASGEPYMFLCGVAFLKSAMMWPNCSHVVVLSGGVTLASS